MHPRLLLVAIQLLTRLPVGDPVEDESDIADSAGWFGVVGALVGGLVAFVWWSASIALPRPAAATAAIIASVFMTGALHEDGLADTADGLFGASDPDRRLAIMRDSAVGSYGVLALVLVLVLRITLLASLSPLSGATALVLTYSVGRGAMPLLVLSAAPARDDGSGQLLLGGLRPRPAIVGLVAALVIGGIVAGAVVLPAAAAAVVVMAAVRASALSRVGGITGDIMGAMVVLGDVAALAVLVGLGVGPALGG